MARKKLQIYAFIDSQNLNLGIREQGWRLDFARLQNLGIKKRGIILRHTAKR